MTHEWRDITDRQKKNQPIVIDVLEKYVKMKICEKHANSKQTNTSITPKI